MTRSIRTTSSCLSLLTLTVLPLFLLCASGLAPLVAQNPAADPQVTAFVKQGNDALAAKNFEDASKAFKKANKLAHDSCFDCWIGQACALEGLGDADSAKNSAARAIATAPDDSARADAHALRGDIINRQSRVGYKYDTNKLKEAEAEYSTALQLAPQKTENHIRLGMVLCREMRDHDAKAEFEKYLQMAPSGQYVGMAKSFIEQPRRARDEAAPQFTVTTLQGETITLKSLNGKFVVLDFWATWCSPCRASVGEMKDLVRKYPADRVVIISVSGDQDEAKWKEFVAQKKMDWHQYRDDHGQMGKLFGVRVIPTYVLIDPEGFIRERIQGENPQQSIVFRLKESLAASLGS